MPTNQDPIPFPGRVLRRNQGNNPDEVRSVQRRLNQLGCGPIEVNGDFDTATFNAVKLFQSRSNDAEGLPLVIDGKVGPLTWAALFSNNSVLITEAASPFLKAVLTAASTQVGTMEDPPHSNRGPQVDEYIRSTGLDPASDSIPWCVAFIYFCFNQAAAEFGQENPMVRTASVLTHWRRSGELGIPRITAEDASNQPGLVKPGHIFVIDTGGGHGHSGLVEALNGGKLVTIEGNSNEGGSAEGIGVFRRQARKITGINKGFIDYSSF